MTISKTLAAALAAAWLAAPHALAAEAAKAPITHESLWMMKRVGTPVASPDGKWVAFPVTEPSYEQDKQVVDLWLVPTAGGAPRPARAVETRPIARPRPDSPPRTLGVEGPSAFAANYRTLAPAGGNPDRARRRQTVSPARATTRT